MPTQLVLGLSEILRSILEAGLPTHRSSASISIQDYSSMRAGIDGKSGLQSGIVVGSASHAQSESIYPAP